MRGLFTKIFLGFWIAQSVTFFISTMLIVRHRFARPNEMMEVLNSTLPSAAAAAANAYEASGCSGLQQFAGSLRQTVYLADSTKHFLCQGAGPAAGPALLAAADEKPGEHPKMVGENYLWSTTTQSPSGKPYLFLLTRRRAANTYGLHELLFFANPQLPVAIVVFGATTFVLVLFLIRPIGRLRLAARKLANGELATRVDEPGGEERLFGGDEIQGLVHDFNYMAERLERLVGAQQILVRDVSHELRSPLARLSVALELAREEAPVAMSEHLQRIEREAGRLNLLIGQLLRLSSMESTNASTPTEVFRLQGLIEDLLPDAEYEAQQRSCTIVVVGHCECMVRGNTDLIYRAIENVVRNAIRYSRPESAVELNMSCEERGGGRTVNLEISDRGPGVPEAELEHIFRPFYRL
ncbi:MAG TPA: histidine kinase dimerization/phospho-acceptor domain-containing protein, partial [Acidobacteriaceae bacterium]|nr:histidine kinase dimerization/phospho-acceptor domain-containing protein [Acidobacteriaceae bacterium]